MTANIRTHLSPFFGLIRLDHIDRKALDKFVAHLFSKTIGKEPDQRTSHNGYLDHPKRLSPKTVKNVMSTLHTMLATAEEWDSLERLPKFPSIKSDESPWDYYEEETRVSSSPGGAGRS